MRVAKGDVVNLQIYACRMLIKKRNKGREEKVIKGGKRSDKYDAVARKEEGTGGVDEVGWWRRVRESVRRITSYLMLRGDSEKGKKRRTR